MGLEHYFCLVDFLSYSNFVNKTALDDAHQYFPSQKLLLPSSPKFLLVSIFDHSYRPLRCCCLVNLNMLPSFVDRGLRLRHAFDCYFVQMRTLSASILIFWRLWFQRLHLWYNLSGSLVGFFVGWAE